MSSTAGPPPPTDDDLTALLQLAHDGDERARSRVFAALYADLRARAARVAREGRGPGAVAGAMRPTTLVHEAYIKMARSKSLSAKSRDHFLLIASRAMRQVLIDHRRAQGSLRRAAPAAQVPLDALVVELERQTGDLVELDEALERLGERDAEMVRAIELRFFSGVGAADTARILGLPLRTFERRWQLAKGWLALQLGA